MLNIYWAKLELLQVYRNVSLKKNCFNISFSFFFSDSHSKTLIAQLLYPIFLISESSCNDIIQHRAFYPPSAGIAAGQQLVVGDVIITESDLFPKENV